LPLGKRNFSTQPYQHRSFNPYPNQYTSTLENRRKCNPNPNPNSVPKSNPFPNPNLNPKTDPNPNLIPNPKP